MLLYATLRTPRRLHPPALGLVFGKYTIQVYTKSLVFAMFPFDLKPSFAQTGNYNHSLGMRDHHERLPMGYKWRSSKWFIIATISIALYAGLLNPHCLGNTR